jgi:ferredoxin
MPLRVIVDRDLCESNAVCVKLAPKVFRIDPDTDKMEVLQEVQDEASRAATQQAVRMCPRGALSIEEAN